jgi:hypothetical protein
VRPQSDARGAVGIQVKRMKIASPKIGAALLLAGAAGTQLLAARQQSSSPPPPVKDPAALAAHDEHQGFLVAADPWLSGEDYKTRFGKKNPYDSGILAIDAYFRNDSDRPVQIKLDDIRLTLEAQDQPQQDVPPLSSREVATDVLSGGGRRPPGPRKIPIPLAGNHSKDWQELEAKLHAAMIPSDIVGPHATVHGLLYFDLDGQFDIVAVARLYVPNLRFIGSTEALIYFDVPLGGAKKK